ncbi:MAG: orotate phosphoribosyltransferase-like protein [Candidatus Methanolliviera sp. GoM_asphalt]|nr:MAG: orotate phosphoribosyltransferase-like protein [Candidatus Methanolliviera sp. GoM_asphalt]
MKGINDLIKKALEMREHGLNTGEIAEDLNVSVETATWLLTRPKLEEGGKPRDIYINWSSIGRSSQRIKFISWALADLCLETLEERDREVDVVLGVATNGIPIGSLVADELATKFGIIHPKKDIKDGENVRSFLSSNFSDVDGKKCIVIDDIITTGKTAKGTIKILKENGAKVIAIAVIIDKKGLEMIDNVPIKSLIQVERI